MGGGSGTREGREEANGFVQLVILSRQPSHRRPVAGDTDAAIDELDQEDGPPQRAAPRNITCFIGAAAIPPPDVRHS
jgi:hypothetical protein